MVFKKSRDSINFETTQVLDLNVPDIVTDLDVFRAAHTSRMNRQPLNITFYRAKKKWLDQKDENVFFCFFRWWKKYFFSTFF